MKHAAYWEYTGNHHAGHDCERKDPHGFGIDLISFVAHVGWQGDYCHPLTFADSQQIKVKKGKPDGFGREVKVSAPAEIWERAKQALEQMEAIA